MDNEEFKRKLSEVAEWHIPEIKLDGPTRRKVRGPRSAEDKYQELHEAYFTEMFGGKNPTAVPEILKVKIAATTCDDCGAHCPNGRKKDRKHFDTGNKSHWREYCHACDKTQNPFTGEFDLSTKEAATQWNSWTRGHTPQRYREDQEAKAVKRAEAIAKYEQEQLEPKFTEVENGDSIIRYYVNNRTQV